VAAVREPLIVVGDGALEVVVLIGLQGAGKTTFYEQRFAATHVLVSKDRLRNNRRPERRQQRLIAEALAAGRSVVVDNTNPSSAERATIVEIARAAGARVVGFVFTSPLEACRARNEARPPERRVPEVGLLAAARRFERPARAEGFDALWSVETLPELRFAVVAYTEGPP
jgi:predicted kinase